MANNCRESAEGCDPTMHELGITRNLVAIVSEQAQGKRVRRVWLEIGERTALLPDAVRFCFDVVAQGTALEGAALDILRIAAGIQCEDCGAYAQPGASVVECAQCRSSRLRQRSGDELNIKAMEVESCA
jgi:hydrogenase nickel incorporation protein HypA/HybF